MKLYSVSQECVTAEEPRWISMRFALFSAAVGVLLFFLLMTGTSLRADFDPAETARLKQENALLNIHLSQYSLRVTGKQQELFRLKEQEGVLNILLHDRTMFGDSFITTVIDLSALRLHAFAPMVHAAVDGPHTAIKKER